jgi:hypothetical protein
MRRIDLSMTVRTACVDEDVNRLPEIVAQWRRASQRMRELGTSDPYTASAMMDIPAEHRALIDTIEADALCRASFSSVYRAATS